MELIIKKFTESLLNWYWDHGRHHLPWQTPYHPYRVWISEIMLQQTQVATVIPYFLKFIAQFPDIQALAQSPLDQVLAAWAGLGYYSRARNLHRTAQIVVEEYQGVFPDDLNHLEKLPGIGRSTAAAIASLAFERPTAILDGNVKRVLSRYFKVPGTDKHYETQLWHYAQACMSPTHCRAYTQAIMDLGATCCTTKNPNCSLCPLNHSCQAFLAQEVTLYPEKKPKKIRPSRYEQFLIFHNLKQEVYLEQRPLTGIWGGLWTTPSIEQNVDLHEYLASQRIPISNIHSIMTLKHSFTHFNLHIHAHAIQTESEATGPGKWYSTSAIQQLGLPKPVKEILNCFYSKTP